MEIEVVRSARRRKTVQGRVVDGKIRISIPSWMSKADEQRHVGEMVKKLQRQRDSQEIDVHARARELARRYGLPSPASVRWVDNQWARWGSCTPADGAIRVSSRLAGFPPWVLDYVLVHELAHLVECNHGPRFYALVDRYPRAERARGFLIAKDLDLDADDAGRGDDGREAPAGDDDVTAVGPVEQGELFGDREAFSAAGG